MKKFLLIAALFLAAVFLPSAPASAASAPPPMKYAFVERVVDAYTLEVSIGRKLQTVRLLGLSPLESLKPETLLKLGDLKAEAYVSSLVANTFVYLEFDTKEKDFEDRLLAYVWLDKPGKQSAAELREKMLNARLLAEGYGEWVLTMPNYKYTNYLRTFGEEAQKKNIGLWTKAK